MAEKPKPKPPPPKPPPPQPDKKPTAIVYRGGKPEGETRTRTDR